MEMLSGGFLSALAAIVLIDLVLAGDNAIVIALAARNLPSHLRGRAILWGTLGAIAVRSAMTLGVVWLLRIPGLLFAGGALLVWIAYKLVSDGDGGNEKHHVDPAAGFWTAMKTIVIADALMGLDNVLAVAGAAQGSFLLVVLGLLISIPIMVWGSQVILKWVVRFPAIIYAGGGVLAWTAVKMMTAEPLLKEIIDGHRALVSIAYLAVIGGVLVAGFIANRAKAGSRVAARVVDIAAIPVAASTATEVNKGGDAMSRILIPVDGSPNALKAVQHAVGRMHSGQPLELHLLHVRTPLTQYAARFVSARNRAAWHREEAIKALQSARSLLERHGIPHSIHIEVGERATTIVRAAQRLQAERIVMGTARKNSLTRLIEDSVTNRVLELTRVPVEVVAGESISRLERFGVPAGFSALLALLYVAAD